MVMDYYYYDPDPDDGVLAAPTVSFDVLEGNTLAESAPVRATVVPIIFGSDITDMRIYWNYGVDNDDVTVITDPDDYADYKYKVYTNTSGSDADYDIVVSATNAAGTTLSDPITVTVKPIDYTLLVGHNWLFGPHYEYTIDGGQGALMTAARYAEWFDFVLATGPYGASNTGSTDTSRAGILNWLINNTDIPVLMYFLHNVQINNTPSDLFADADDPAPGSNTQYDNNPAHDSSILYSIRNNTAYQGNLMLMSDSNYSYPDADWLADGSLVMRAAGTLINEFLLKWGGDAANDVAPAWWNARRNEVFGINGYNALDANRVGPVIDNVEHGLSGIMYDPDTDTALDYDDIPAYDDVSDYRAKLMDGLYWLRAQNRPGEWFAGNLTNVNPISDHGLLRYIFKVGIFESSAGWIGVGWATHDDWEFHDAMKAWQDAGSYVYYIPRFATASLSRSLMVQLAVVRALLFAYGKMITAAGSYESYSQVWIKDIEDILVGVKTAANSRDADTIIVDEGEVDAITGLTVDGTDGDKQVFAVCSFNSEDVIAYEVFKVGGAVINNQSGSLYNRLKASAPQLWYPLGEVSGTVASNIGSESGVNGVYEYGVQINDPLGPADWTEGSGSPLVSFPNSNSAVNLYSAAANTFLNDFENITIFFAFVYASGMFDGTEDYFYQIGCDDTTNNSLAAYYYPSEDRIFFRYHVDSQYIFDKIDASALRTGINLVAMERKLGVCKTFVNGTQYGGDSTPTGTWSSTDIETHKFVIGNQHAENLGSKNTLTRMAHFAIWQGAANQPADAAALTAIPS